MRKERISCDRCGDDVGPLGEKYAGFDLCEPCLRGVVLYWFSVHNQISQCPTCKGKGKVAGERIDSPCCGENRPEYSYVRCPRCQGI